jgi:hypothetical protein
MANNEQTVFACTAEMEKHKAEYGTALRAFHRSRDANEAVEKQRELLKDCRDKGVAFFNVVERCIAGSELLGAHRSEFWASDLANTASNVLDFIPSFYAEIREEANRLKLPPLMPAPNAYSAMQNAVLIYNPDQIDDFKRRFQELGLPIRGFTHPAPLNAKASKSHKTRTSQSGIKPDPNSGSGDGSPSGSTTPERAIDGLWKILQISAKALPINKLAVGVVGVGAAVAILSILIRDKKTAVFGILIVICLMAILLMLTWAKKYGPQKAPLLVISFLWLILLSFAVILGVVVSAFAWGVPAHAATFLGFTPPAEVHEQIQPGVSSSTQETSTLQTGMMYDVSVTFSLAKASNSVLPYLQNARSICEDAIRAYTENGEQTAVLGALVIPPPMATGVTDPSVALHLEKTSLGEIPDVLSTLTPNRLEIYPPGNEFPKTKPVAHLQPQTTEHTLFYFKNSDQFRLEVTMNCTVMPGGQDPPPFQAFKGSILMAYDLSPKALNASRPLASIETFEVSWRLTPRGREVLSTLKWKVSASSPQWIFYGFDDMALRPKLPF